MIIGLDSATPPSSTQVTAARSAGISLWNGYLQTHSGVGLYRAWSQSEFDVVKALPGKPIAYVSGNDDPYAVKAQAQSWGVLPCLDVERLIRPDGTWVQSWLNASGAGLYGNLAVHAGRTASFHVLSWYVADPKSTFVNTARPNTPCGWQWQNTHDEFGVGVDRCWFDDWFGGINKLTDAELVTMHHIIQLLLFGAIDPSGQAAFVNAVKTGTGMNAIFDGWFNTDASKAWRAKLATANQPGPIGPQGAIGPQGSPGPAGPAGTVPAAFDATITLK